MAKLKDAKSLNKMLDKILEDNDEFDVIKKGDKVIVNDGDFDENFGSDVFNVDGIYTLNNTAGIEVEVSKDGDGVRYRTNFGGKTDEAVEAEVLYGNEGRAYFMYGDIEIYLDEVMLVHDSNMKPESKSESKVKYGDTEHSVIKIGDSVKVNAGRFKNAIATVIDMAISGGNNYKVEFEDGTKAIIFPHDLKLAESKVNKNTGESKMTSKAGSFLKNLNKLPERYQLMLEDMTKTTNAELIPQDLAIVLTKMTANSLMANNVPIYVRTGTGKEAAEGKSGKIKSTEQRTANDWTVACYGGVVEMSQPVVSVYNVKTKESWTASTSKENLKKWGNGGTTESKKKVSESFFKKEGEVNFETLANLKKELTGFGLKDGLDFNANLFGESLELYLKMPANALPEQISDLIERYGFGGEEGPSVDFEKEIKTSDGEEVENVSVNAEAPSEAKKKVAKKTTKKKVAKKKSILRKPKLASGKKAVSKIKKF